MKIAKKRNRGKMEVISHSKLSRHGQTAIAEVLLKNN
jgi:hypothetical protein